MHIAAPKRCWTLLLSATLIGCSGGGLTTVPVTGTITLDGNPVSGAGVLFAPLAEGPPASGTTDEQGRYTLVTAERSGAVPGEHRVTVNLQKVSGIAVDESGLEGSVGSGGIKTEWVVPQKYSRPDTSGLTATVTSDKTEYNFELTSK